MSGNAPTAVAPLANNANVNGSIDSPYIFLYVK